MREKRGWDAFFGSFDVFFLPVCELLILQFFCCCYAPGCIPDFENIMSISDAIGSSLMIQRKNGNSHGSFFFGHSSFYVWKFLQGVFSRQCTVKYRNWHRNIINEAMFGAVIIFALPCGGHPPLDLTWQV